MVTLDKRAKKILKAIVWEYIKDGTPVGSRSLSKITNLNLSPATLRNVMSDLEEMGLLSSLHVSSGRIPTVDGLRVFIDTLLTIRPVKAEMRNELAESLSMESTGTLIESATNIVNNLTRQVSLIVVPKEEIGIIKRVQFVKLSQQRILIVIVTMGGEVINKIITSPKEYKEEEFIEAMNYFNYHFKGKSISQVKEILKRQTAQLSEKLSKFLEKTVDEIQKERNLRTGIHLNNGENFFTNTHHMPEQSMKHLRRLLDLFQRQKDFLQLFNLGQRADSVKIFIGSECGIPGLEDMSVVTSPFEVDGEFFGVLGVIGPIRMRYEKIIPIVDITAKLTGQALKHIQTDLD